MNRPFHQRQDPIGWTALVALAFACLCAIRLTIPDKPFFDEVHYVPAARTVLDLSHPLNIEHPPLGKQLIALGMAIFGDNALGWRIMPAIFGVLAVIGGTRAMWFASGSAFASIACGILLLTGFPLLVEARIAMLDIFMAGFAMLALWMFAATIREPETARWRLAIVGVALGCAMASKWNAIPLAMMPGMIFLIFRIRSAGRRFLTSRRGAPIPGMTLAEAALWLGLLPLLVYAACYWPFFFYRDGSITPLGLIDLHERMLSLQEQLLKPHTYQSVWYQWVLDWRAIWYLYEPIGGAQRGVLMLGNPLTMIAGLPALAWCAWKGMFQRRWDMLAVAACYAVTLGLWVVAAKNVQFYYHYMLPSCFLLAALALALDDLRRSGRDWIAWAILAGSVLLFAHFWPILSAARLDDQMAFEYWMWLDSWR